MAEEIKVELQAALATIRDQFDKEEQSVRESQIRLWKRLEYYWDGFTNVWWNDVAHDWRVFDNYNPSSDDSYYDKSINVFQAYTQSIIAALSATVPPVKCIPDDANNGLDVTTAKGGSKIAELIYKHIDAQLLWVKALLVFNIQGAVFAYNYTDYDEKYGTVELGKYEDSEEEIEAQFCPNCNKQLTEPELSQAKIKNETEQDEFDPDEDDVDLNKLMSEGVVCESCMSLIDPELRKTKIVVKRLVGTTNEPKARQCVEILGGLYVKVPNYAADLTVSPYIAYEYETHYTNVLKRFKHLRKADNTNTAGRITSTQGGAMYDRWGRLSTQYRGEYPLDTPTCRNWWFRPSAFEAINDEKLRKELQDKFPDGCKVVWVNDEFAEICAENLDDHWTASRNPLSNYIHHQPAGLLLTSVQDITNDLISLTLQTIEHGVPTTIVEPNIINFDEYRQTEVRPGDIIQAKARGGKNLGDAFYQFSTATLSKEVGPFGDQINEMAQFVSGAMPSIWGGAQAGGSSRTAAQATMSRNQSLQRLQIPWKTINVFWKNLFGKVIPSYIKTMMEDERVVREVHGNFINEIIRRSELEGKLGSVELESTDDIPYTSAQVKDAVMQLVSSGNPQLLQMIFSPENIPLLAQAIGLNSLVIPGEKDREKQYDEISQLLEAEPTQNPQTGQPESSIQPDQDLDNHQVEAEICRDWLMSETGRSTKVTNPTGYENVLLHFKAHVMFMRMMAPAPPSPQPQQQQKPEPKLRAVQ
jgi:hypothetical protein